MRRPSPGRSGAARRRAAWSKRCTATILSCMATVASPELAKRARRAARILAGLDRGAKDAALEAIAGALERSVDAVLEANAADLADARESGTSDALLDRLALDPER